LALAQIVGEFFGDPHYDFNTLVKNDKTSIIKEDLFADLETNSKRQPATMLYFGQAKLKTQSYSVKLKTVKSFTF